MTKTENTNVWDWSSVIMFCYYYWFETTVHYILNILNVVTWRQMELRALQVFIKDFHNQRSVQCGHFSDKGGDSDAIVRTFWWKNLQIFDILVCSHGQDESNWASADNGSQFFVSLCGHLLWMAPYGYVRLTSFLALQQ